MVVALSVRDESRVNVHDNRGNDSMKEGRKRGMNASRHGVEEESFRIAAKHSAVRRRPRIAVGFPFLVGFLHKVDWCLNLNPWSKKVSSEQCIIFLEQNRLKAADDISWLN